MTDQEAVASIRRLYVFTLVIAAIGFVSYWLSQGFHPAAGFAFGALASFGNLWLYDRMTRAIAPGTGSRKPWQATAFISRYLLLFTGGYVIVKALNVNPLAVVLGLLSSTAAILTSVIFETLQRLFVGRSTH